MPTKYRRLSKNKVNKILPCFSFELDESYFGGPKKKIQAVERRKRGLGAENKIPVFGIKKRNDWNSLHKIIENAQRKTLFPIISELIKKQDSMIYTDKFRTYDGLVFNGYKHKRINHSMHLKKSHTSWNKRLGVDGADAKQLQQAILAAGNQCTYFAPSISGISLSEYALHNLFAERSIYFDNFFINNWSKNMIQILLEASGSVFILHRDFKQIIQNFQEKYLFRKPVIFDGCTKDGWRDNDAAIVLDIGNGLILWSTKAD